ncbi:MAG: hypothetical protein HQ523_02055 [Lentisphaerae bacterium]|nr:hypothetical protein [Lentisphaerota bacterium]
MKTSHWWKGPVKADPDFGQLLKVLRREVPDRPTLFEFFLNAELQAFLAGDDERTPENTVHAFRNAGYDYATICASDFSFPLAEQAHAATISQNEGVRITDRTSFEQYPWPDPNLCDYTPLERAAAARPEGMQLICHGPGGVIENMISLVGYDNLCYLLVDDPALTREIFDAIGTRLVAFYKILLQHDAVGAIIGNDDWGYKTQPMIAPDDMRAYVVPWHRQIAAAAHATGKPAIMHSCGNLVTLMDDIIDDIGYDAKHSYEDTIMPVETAYDTYGHRIAILGGLDLDFVIRSPEAAVYKRAGQMLERAAEKGGYALGTGNSVPAYVPAEHYFAMTAAALEQR